MRGSAGVGGRRARFLDTTAAFVTPSARGAGCENFFLERYPDPLARFRTCSHLGSDVAVLAGMRLRWVVLETRGALFAAALAAHGQRALDAALAPARRVLDGLRFGP